MTVSFIVATIGRPSLSETLASIETWPGAEVIVLGNVPDTTDGCVRYVASPPGGDWGATERNVAMPMARGQYLAHIDDDDVYVPGARAILAEAIAATPNRPMVFRMEYWDGLIVWQDQVMRPGNIGTPMVITPNDPAKLGRWGEGMYTGDFHFYETMGWTSHDLVWRTEILTKISRRGEQVAP